MSKKITVSVLNRSDKKIVTDSELDALVHNALQPQVSDDLFPAWRVDAEVLFADQPIPNSWWLVILDKTDQDGWLGYHLTSEGMPLAKVFAGTVKENKGIWTVTASHELLEMLADPEINRMISDRTFAPGHLPKEGEKKACFYALEVCDPCSSEEFAYNKNGSMVSDFILPSWYNWETKADQCVDYNQKIRGPFRLPNGGYAGIYNNVDGWKLLGRDNLPTFRQTLLDAGRMKVRGRPRTQWKPVAAGVI